ncbi:MAG: hypothetical protein ACK47B_20885 [Armatimonadota bacterium]
MHPKLIGLAAILTASALTTAGLTAAPEGEAVTPSLRADLQRRITIWVGKSSLAEVHEQLERQTGVRFKAHPAIADEPAVVLVADRPAGEVMQQLSAVFDYRWRRVREGDREYYELFQDRDSREREEALIRQQEERLLGALLAQIKAPPEGVEPRLPPPPGGAVPPSPQQGVGGETLRKSLLLLSREHWQALLNGETLHLSHPQENGSLPLPRELAQELHQARLPGNSAEPRDEYWPRVIGFRVSAWLERQPYSLRLTTRAVPLLADAEPGQPGQSHGLHLSGTHFVERPEPASPEEIARWKQDPVLGQKQRFGPDLAALVPPHRRHGGRFSTYLHELLPEIARAYRINLVSDAYQSSQLLLESRQAEELPLYEVLNRYLFPKSGWERDGDYLRVRSRTWYLDRGSEVPLRLVRDWAAALRQKPHVDLDQAGEMVRALSDEQLRQLPDALADRGIHLRGPGLPSFVRPGGSDGHGALEMLRAYAQLHPGQRRPLQRGESVAVSSMPDAARRWTFRALDRRQQQHPERRLPELQPTDRLTMSVSRWSRDSSVRTEGVLEERYTLLDGPEAGKRQIGGLFRLPPGSAPHPALLKIGQTMLLAHFQLHTADTQRTFTFQLPWLHSDPEQPPHRASDPLEAPPGREVGPRDEGAGPDGPNQRERSETTMRQVRVSHAVR